MALPEQVVTVDGQPTTPPPPCTGGEIRYSSDNCEVTNVDVACPVEGGGTLTQNGKVVWSGDAESGEGTFAFTLTDASGAVVCSGSYDVTAEKL